MTKKSNGGVNLSGKLSALFGIMVATLVVALFGSFGANRTHAASESVNVNVSLTVLSACSLGASTDTFSSTIQPGTTSQIGANKTITITCNGTEGYSLYANGLNSAGEPGHTDLVGTTASNVIKTGTATSGDTSNWNFKLSSPSSGVTIASGFDAAHAIPASGTLIASRNSGVTAAAGDNVTITYSAYISSTQSPDTYSGKVKYTLFQPATSTASKLMQDFSCSDLSADQTTTLLDTRDGNTYKVAKLKDGKCWMTENLRLGKSSTMTLTPSDSDVSGSFTLPVSSISGFTSGDYDTAWVYIDGTYGGYYSWKAATAGTGTGAMASGNATSSICPKGWRLPTGGSGGEFEALAKSYGSGTDQATSTALRATPVPNFTLAGYYINGSPGNQGSYGRLWSSTAVRSENAYNLYLLSSSVSPTGSNEKNYGFAVRCVAR